jgi:ligand-binding SRPBCC domain-containing protein
VTVVFENVTLSVRSQRDLFDRARDIGVHVLSQSGSDEKAADGVTSGLIEPDEEVTFIARHFGIRFTLTSRITEFDAPTRFVDEQVRGPFKTFRHEHLFTEVDSEAQMIDRVTFAAPFGVIGTVVERLILAPYLKRLIRNRGLYLSA